jgi:16S rRNA (cytosine967-C5)-methyltransferase
LAPDLARLKDISPARRTAFEILRQVERGAFSSVLLAAGEVELDPRDRALAHELVLGVLRWQLFLDRIVEHFSKKKVEDLDLPVRIALRLGLYQLRFLTRIPPSAAVNESVSLVRSAKLSSATSFVNAVLRRATREPDFDPSAAIVEPVERLAVQTSHPVWLIERWLKSFGPETTTAFARGNNEQPPTAFRVVHETNVIDQLNLAGAHIEPSKIASGAWRVAGANQLVRELAQTGKIYIQDEASQLVAHKLDPQPGERVLDVCAAPGGKTTLIATRAEDRAIVIACDISFDRLETLGKSIELQQVGSIQRVVLNAGQGLPFWCESFDRVLLDAPCSGTGTLRHNPEIKWRLTRGDVEELADQQRLFLRNAAEVVKPGGRLVYSTCSVEVEENEAVISDFLAKNQRFAATTPSHRTWPQTDGCDGFFVTTLQRPNH